MDGFSPVPSPMRGHLHRPPSTTMMRSPPPRTSSRSSIAGRPLPQSEDSKTAVKVAIRVRPPLQPSDPGYDLIPHRFRTSTCEVTSPTNIAIQSSHGRKLFVFDRVFGENEDQEGVWDYLSDSVESFVQGYNVSILAYGQSGAGKSYTMGTSGPDEQKDPVAKGVVPRAAAALFEKLTGSSNARPGLRAPYRYSTQDLSSLRSNKQSPNPDKDWQLTATYVEIYNEQLRDLLVPESVPQNERAQVSIREDTKGRILLTGLTQIDINSVEDLLNALNFGSTIRQTDATAINAKSSRSHAVFSLNLVRRKPGSPEISIQDKRRSVPLESMTASSDSSVTTDSKLHFVDLAGSERLKNTGAQGERAKEGISINAGLASLGKVISQLSSRQSGGHISYRDSRLTRLLQDSLGGNAITYMVACVTPAEFHLSETLNTVHYAQRARAIQSKPEIQHSSDDGDKNARIERLQAEVAFLREQITHEQTARPISLHERPEHRQAAELQNQLMDMQESYNALSGRHARLITELGRHRQAPQSYPLNGAQSETIALTEKTDALGASATDRLQRSSSFADAVEQVVLEYETTIRSLETSLLNTRTHLSSTESTLMERETKISHMENVAQQLQSRLHKMSEREATNDAYLRDLETQLEEGSISKESSSTLVKGLRKELGRAKDTQTSSEGYIATLEERLAEAEQDHDILKRELDRLEQVVERQRSIGRLDNLLSDLDTIRQAEPQASIPMPKTRQNGYSHNHDDPFGVKGHTPPSPLEPEALGLGIDTGPNGSPSPVSPLREDELRHRSRDSHKVLQAAPMFGSEKTHGRAQNRFMADKLETLTQELFDLRGEHESTITDYSDLQRKYTVALHTLARLQDSHNDNNSEDNASPSKSEAFLGPVSRDLGDQARPDSSPSASLSHLSRLPSTTYVPRAVPSIDTSGGTLGTNNVDLTRATLPHDTPTEAAVLVDLNRERNADMRQLNEKHTQLAKSHSDALLQIELLKLELQKTKFEAPSPSRKSPRIRRKPSMDAVTTMGNIDRANRSFASLRNIALDHFESNPDVRQNFELQLNTIMTELHSRSERLQSNDADITTLRKQIEDKSTIIAGLTRERSTLKTSSNVDFSVVGQMQDQLMESEHQIRMLQESYEKRVKDLQDEIGTLKQRLDSISVETAPKGQEEPSETSKEVERLREELSNWQAKHNHAIESSKSSESHLLSTITALEAALQSATAQNGPKNVGEASQDLDQERSKHREIVASLQRQISDHTNAGQEHTEKLSELQASHAGILRQVEEDGKTRELNEQELRTHRELVKNLGNQLEAHKATIALHEKSLETLHQSHVQKLRDLQTSTSAAERKSNDRYAALANQHNVAIEELEAEIKAHQDGMAAVVAGAAAALGHETNASKLEHHIREVVGERQDLEMRHAQFANDKATMQEELATVMANNAELQTRVSELRKLHEEATHNVQQLTQKEAKSSRLVQELEDQLNSNYDQHAETNRRMSTMHTEKQLQLEEALHARSELEKDMEDSRLKINVLETQISDLRRRSASTVRDSTGFRDPLSPEAAAIALARSSTGHSIANNLKTPLSATALPSPPPAIPLPPLPGTSTPGSISPMIHNDRAVSPGPVSRPPSSHMPHSSIDSNLAHVVEEQETRIRTVEKHLYAEKQLTATLEEALVDLETAQNRTRAELDVWRKKAANMEDEIMGLRREHSVSRASIQQVEEEREMRMRAEQARIALEARMRELNNGGKKKKKGTLNCF